MASPAKTGSSKHEIVARHDGYCCLCRGKTIKGSRIWWDKDSGLVHHVECPPVVEVAADVYRGVPVTPDRWREFCQQIRDMISGGVCTRQVVDEDRKAFETEGASGMIRSIIGRTRCTGAEAVEIARSWIDSLRAPVDEEKFQRLNQSCRREQPVKVGEGSPTTDDEYVDWDAEE